MARRRPAREQGRLMVRNRLYNGENLAVLRSGEINAESVDLIYLDPPFNSKQDYNMIFKEQTGLAPIVQKEAFKDTWEWNQNAMNAFHDTLDTAPPVVATRLLAFRTMIGENNTMLAYLSMMAPRLVEMWKVLKPTGSIYLHCDPTASHYLKLLMDAVFDPGNFRNEIVWRRTGYNSAAKRYGPIHQTIFYYVKSPAAPFYPTYGPYTVGYVRDYFTGSDERGMYRPVLLTGSGVRTGSSGKPWRHYDPTSSGRHWAIPDYLHRKYKAITGDDLSMFDLTSKLEKLDAAGLIHWGRKENSVPNYKYYLDDAPGVMYQDMWGYVPGTEGAVYGRPKDGIDQDVKWLGPKDKEALHYPTQKPEGILDRIIESSSRPGDIVLDPFCGCGTTISVAHRLNRQWIGIDHSRVATDVIEQRLEDTYGADIKKTYEFIAKPVTVEDARKLKGLPFEWWAVERAGAQPSSKRGGGDAGIDGRIYFREYSGAGKIEAKQVVISVKSGKPMPRDVRELRGVIEREDAALGVLILMYEPTEQMIKEAASAGRYYSETWETSYPRLQIVTVDKMLDERPIDYPGRLPAVAEEAAAQVRNTKTSMQQQASSSEVTAQAIDGDADDSIST